MSDLAVKLAAEALATHRWKSMGVASAECECGAVLYGDADPFPADDAFRRHLAESILAAAAPALVAAERAKWLLAVRKTCACDDCKTDIADLLSGTS